MTRQLEFHLCSVAVVTIAGTGLTKHDLTDMLETPGSVLELNDPDGGEWVIPRDRILAVRVVDN